MSSSASLLDLSVRAFAGALAHASSAPDDADGGVAPGGGSAAAAANAATVIGAFGAGLVSMTLRIAADEGESDHDAFLMGRVAELDDLRELLIELVERDREAYGRFLAAEEGEERDKAQIEALEARMESAEFSLAALRLALVSQAAVPARVACDLVTGVRALEAAARGALAIAAFNGSALPADSRSEYELTIASLTGEVERLVAQFLAADASTPVARERVS